MPSRHSIITLIIIAALALLPLPAQDGLSDWEEKAALFESDFNPDSLAFYYRKITAYHRTLDSIAPWAYAWWDWQAVVFDDTPLALSLLDSATQQAWRGPRNNHEAEALVWVQVNRGYHLFQLGKVLASVKAYEAAQQWLLQYPIPDFDALEYLYLPLGAHYTRLGDNEKARALYEQAIREHPHGPQDGALAGLYNNLGLTWWNEGNQQEAIAAFERGLACREAPPIKTALLHFSMAQSCLAAGLIEQAEANAAAAIAGLEEVNISSPEEEGLTEYLAGAYSVKAKLLAYYGRTAPALPLLEKALEMTVAARGTARHRDVAKLQVELGHLHLQRNDEAQALRAFHEALAGLIPGLPEEELSAMPETAQLYEENAIYEALEGKADALEARYARHRQVGDLHLGLACHRLAAHTETMLRRLLQYESSKISLLSQSRRRAGKALAIARELYALTGDEAFLYEAWAIAEQVKAVILLEAVQNNRFRNMVETDDPLPAEERRIRQQAAYFERQLLLEPASPLRAEWVLQLEELKRQLAETERQLQLRYPAWASLRAQSESFSGAYIMALRDSLPGYALVEYFVGDAEIEAFGQSPQGEVVWKTIPGADSLGVQVQDFLSLLQSRTALQSPEAYRRGAYHLYAQLLEPLRSAFGEQPRNLLIVPDAWLAFLPFEALYSEPAPEAGWEQAPFLLRHYGIHYDFSLAVAQSRRGLSGRAAGNIAQFAPRFRDGRRNLPPLLQSAGEAPVSHTCKSRQYADEAASFETLRKISARYCVLHLSTHAGVDTGGALPRVEFHDRPAYLPDVYALELQAELVVLSACQTALGQFRRGEGVMSLSRAFTYAGAKGLVASLWAINEASTAKILQQMYAGLHAGEAKPRALQEAKLHYLDDADVPAWEKSPYYWAGLVYTGDEQGMAWEKCRSGWWWALLGLPVLLWGGWRILRRQ